MKVIIPTEISMPTAKTVVQDQRDNDEELIRQLDSANEMWGDSAIWMASYHKRAISQYNKKAWPQLFRPGTLVLKKIFENTTEIDAKKLQAN